MPFLFFIILLVSNTSFAQNTPLCGGWSATKTLATLPGHKLPEISGLVASPTIPDRYYMINDSGDGARFYAYDAGRGTIQTVDIAGIKAWDIEALSFGTCGNQSCLLIGDIGDNKAKRKIIRITGIAEQENFNKKVRPVFHKILKYPDGGKDAEGMVLSKKGDLYIFAKHFGILTTSPTEIYKVSMDQLMKSKTEDTLEKIAQINLGGYVKNPVLTVTDAALSPDDSRLFLMGYINSFEVDFNEILAIRDPQQTVNIQNYVAVETSTGLQTEAVTYSADGKDLIWTYEGKGRDLPLMQKACLN